jgi:hypothetical protein
VESVNAKYMELQHEVEVELLQGQLERMLPPSAAAA